MKSAVKIVLVVGAATGAFALLRTPAVLAHLPSSFAKTITLDRVQMPAIADAVVANVKPAPYPSDSPASVPATLIRGGIWEWNAQNGLLLANGGKLTTKGSLMAKYQVNLSLERQDDTGKMSEGLVSCAKELKDGAKQCSTGYNFVIVMGGGAAQFVATTNANLAKLGPEYKLKTIAAVGRSNGEDGFWAPASFKLNPHSISQTEMTDASGEVLPVHGLLITGVIRDDDWNIAQKFAGDNSIPNNPDEKTFDPDAINWINSSDYNVAAADFVATKCEDRTLVKASHSTGQKVHVCANGTVTWTPGDVVAATKRGGVVPVATSKQYLMPAVIVGPAKFFSDNREEIDGMLAGGFEGGDQVRAYDAALKKACEIAAQVYNDEGDTGFSHGAYWYKYAKGVTQPDAKGVMVPLGGSAVYGLQDNLALFGIQDGKNDDFRSLYNVFSAIDLKEYPSLFKSSPIPPVSDVEIKSYIHDAQDRLADSTIAAAAPVSYSQSGSVIGDRSYSITFATGSAVPLPDGVAILNQLKDSLAVTRVAIEVNGHTDDTGSPEGNQDLSRRRAQAVEDYLNSAAPSSFPRNRFEVHGYGSQKPVASNATPEGKAQNRRVEIVLHSS